MGALSKPALAHDEQMEAYSEAVRSGLYDKRSGLTGKYDNVRRYWEDEVTRNFLRPHLQRLIERSQQSMRRLRILDLGCGSADGFELLSGIRDRDANLQDTEINLLKPEMLGLYKGIDLCGDLLEQARRIYGHNPKMVFETGNFAESLNFLDDKPYDLCFTSYGTCSHHNDDATLIDMLVKIAERVEDYCIIVCDWLGRYSYEWQSLWVNDLDALKNMDYVVSYIYEKEERERRRDELQHLTLRLMSRPEAEHIISEASRKAGVEIRPLTFFDRSIFTGRHMDTREYNPHAQPLRRVVNSLHETNTRTNLDSLIINYVPKQGFEFINDYFEHLQMCWNALVEYTMVLLQSFDESKRAFSKEPPTVPASYPPVLRSMMDRIRLVVQSVGWLGIGLPRENIIEPQLGYALRHLVTSLQQALSCGHGFVSILEVEKK